VETAHNTFLFRAPHILGSVRIFSSPPFVLSCSPLFVLQPASRSPPPWLDFAGARRIPSQLLPSIDLWAFDMGSTDERFGSGLFPAADVPALPNLAISQDGALFSVGAMRNPETTCFVFREIFLLLLRADLRRSKCMLFVPFSSALMVTGRRGKLTASSSGEENDRCISCSFFLSCDAVSTFTMVQIREPLPLAHHMFDMLSNWSSVEVEVCSSI
jgi:hypothetical protein